jgi:DNA-binding NarL/FixJ family response regulator
MNTPITLAIADDHQLLREGFKTMFRLNPEIKLVAEAENGAVLLELIEKHKPDIVITDIRMPVETCKQIVQKYPTVGVIALSSYDNDHLVIDMLDAGAKGYLMKNTDKNEVAMAVKAVYEGGNYFCDHISVNLQKLLSQTRHSPYKEKHKITFSQRELEIIKLSSQEFTNKEIASFLNLSTRTVEAHKVRMQTRLEAKNMVGVIMYAIRNKMIEI